MVVMNVSISKVIFLVINKHLPTEHTHFHPSGDPTPSREDIEVTKRLVECGQIIGIEVLDHIIIGDHKFVSLKEKGHI